jgi:hypothetical protein
MEVVKGEMTRSKGDQEFLLSLIDPTNGWDAFDGGVVERGVYVDLAVLLFFIPLRLRGLCYLKDVFLLKEKS